MSRHRRMRLPVVVACATVAALLTAWPASAEGSRGSRASTTTTIADGFDGPLGLAVDKRGTAHVVESFTGALTRVSRRGKKTTVFTATDGGLPGGVAVLPNGRALFTKTTSEDPSDPEAALTDTTLEVLTGRDRSRTIASLLEYEKQRNPDSRQTYGLTGLSDACRKKLPEEDPGSRPYPGIVESNPYAVTTHRGAAVVADAAGNSILRVKPNGRISTIAVLPPVRQRITAALARELKLPKCVVGRTYRSEPVPTDVEVGPDGHLYVSSLPGAPEGLANGSVFKVNPWNGKVRRIASGFRGAVDLAVDHRGTIYVADLFGDAIKAIRHGRVRTVFEVTSPGAVEMGPHGRLYATTNVSGDDGQGSGTLVSINVGRAHR